MCGNGVDNSCLNVCSLGDTIGLYRVEKISNWQIGVDVLPEYRRQGIAATLTSTLAVEILKRGRVPFYCSAWSNIRSVRNAIKSGFLPAWVEMTVKPTDIVDAMNK